MMCKSVFCLLYKPYESIDLLPFFIIFVVFSLTQH